MGEPGFPGLPGAMGLPGFKGHKVRVNSHANSHEHNKTNDAHAFVSDLMKSTTEATLHE